MDTTTTIIIKTTIIFILLKIKIHILLYIKYMKNMQKNRNFLTDSDNLIATVS